jgi:hypothetical protein
MSVTPNRPRGTGVSDNEVTEYIRAHLAAGARPRKTSLLRDFRESGRACEQSRFARLFEEVQRGVQQ